MAAPVDLGHQCDGQPVLFFAGYFHVKLIILAPSRPSHLMHLKPYPVILSHKGQHPSVRRIPPSHDRFGFFPFSTTLANNSIFLHQLFEAARARLALPVEVFDQGDDQLVFELGRHPNVELVLLAPLQVMHVQTNPVVFRDVGHHLSLGALLLADYGF